jgi:hypothetical protein
MISAFWNSKRLRRMVAIATLVCAVAVLSISLMRPKPTPDTGLGDGWQCSKTAGMLTVCTKIAQVRPASGNPGNASEHSLGA